MYTIKVRNTHEALPEIIRLIDRLGAVVGSVKTFSGTFRVVYERPSERAVFWPTLDMNPFLCLFGSLWSLSGLKNIGWISQFAYKEVFNNYLHYRLHSLTRLHKTIDVLNAAKQVCETTLLKHRYCNHYCRINTIDTNSLNMEVSVQGNDIIRDCTIDMPCFTTMQEYLAAFTNFSLGHYEQINTNSHILVSDLKVLRPLVEESGDIRPDGNRLYPLSPYETDIADAMPISPGESFNQDLKMLIEEGYSAIGYSNRFLRRVALPMLQAYHIFRHVEGERKYHSALETIKNIGASDWQLACRDWISRRYDEYKRSRQ